ncbi:MAG: arylamine N-acetyltransferase, partial [Acidobacteria bacterium]|nr:arylamine N-acetyltransferase [Acidobacteriota bacterium]
EGRKTASMSWVDDYLRRTGAASPAATLPSLRALHLAHRLTFLFENLDIQRGRGVRVDLPSVVQKFVVEGRGGYCFEHNTLFAALLREAGFPVTAFLGRVRRGPPERWVRTHMLLRVLLGGEPWIADVGFGGIGLLEPIPLAEGATSTQGGVRYTLRREGVYWVLATVEADGGTTDRYEFTEEPQTEGDVEMANHYTSTHPDSIFRKTLTIQRARLEERTILRGDLLLRVRDGAPREELVARDRLTHIAREVFAVELEEGPFVFDGAS